jgi:hypothetical protein
MLRGQLVRAPLVGAILFSCLAAGCADTYQEGNRAPAHIVYLPNAVTMLPPIADGGRTRHFALLGNSDINLRFASAWISVLDVDALMATWDGTGDIPEVEPSSTLILQQLRVPPSSGLITVDTSGIWEAGQPRHLAFVGHRGYSMLTVIEITVDDSSGHPVPKLSCGQGGGSELGALARRTDCDADHLVSLDDALIKEFVDTVPKEDALDPYAMVTYPWLGAQELAVTFLSHTLTTNTPIMRFQVAKPGEAFVPRSTDTAHPDPEDALRSPNPFLAPLHHLLAGSSQATIPAVAVRPQNDAAGLACQVDPSATDCTFRLSVGSRFYALGTNTASVTTFNFEPRKSDKDGYFYSSSRNLDTQVAGTSVTALKYSTDGLRGYVSLAGPNSLVAVDTSLLTQRIFTAAGPYDHVVPRFDPLDFVPLASQPQGMVVLDRPEGDLVATNLVLRNEVALTAAAGARLVPVAQVRDVGTGPLELDSFSDDAGDVLVVVTFYDNGVTLVRVPSGDPASASKIARMRSASLGDVVP